MSVSHSSKDIKSTIKELSKKFNVVEIVDFTGMMQPDWIKMHAVLKKAQRHQYQNRQRILIVMDHDWYDDIIECGVILEAVQRMLNNLDISNFFIELITSNQNIESELRWIKYNVSADPVSISATICIDRWNRWQKTHCDRFDVSCTDDTIDHSVEEIEPEHYDLLFRNPSFCMAPWSHVLVDPDQKVYPCCNSRHVMGDLRYSNIEEIWNDQPLKTLRKDMLQGIRNQACNNCHVLENIGKNSYRQYINRKLIHRVSKTDLTQHDGTHKIFEINYLHFKFSNLCNLACRTCGPMASSSWHKVSRTLGDIPVDFPILQTSNADGKLFDEFVKHLDTIDLIKFTGGEPLIMQEFYDILDLLIDKKHTDVDLFYNTNLMQLTYRKRNILDLWKNFSRVVVGASLDAEGARGEYLRSFSHWPTILENCRAIKDQCPNVYFFISPTISIINAWHLPDFHRSCVDQGLINAQDFDINVLSHPAYLSVANAPDTFKSMIKDRYLEHLTWTYQNDRTGRSTGAFQSVINLLETDGSFLRDEFWHHADRLDRYHDTELLSVFPELFILPR